LGFGVPELAGILSPLIGGEKVSTWTDSLGETFDVVIRLPHDQRANIGAIKELMLMAPSAVAGGNPLSVRLDQVADIDLVPGASEIRRLDLSREVLISADVSGGPV